VSLDINDDAGFEDESLILNLAVTSGTADLDISQHTVTIVDDEVAPALTTIALQDFDGTSPSWSYTTSPEENSAACNSGNDVWNVVSSLGSITVPNSTGDFFGGRDLNGATGCGTSDVGTIDFSSINVSDFSSSVLSFDYEVDGFNSSSDELSYIVYFDASPEAEVFLCDGCNQQNLEGTVMVNIPNGTERVSLQVRAQFDGGSDYFGVDNFKVAGLFNGLVYTGGAWSPMDPDNSTGASDAIVIDGTATFAADAALNDVNILPGAAVRVNSGVTLGTNTLGLKSTSSTFSSLIVDGTVTGTVAYERYVNSNDPINGNDLISAPLSGQNFNTFFGNNPNILSNPSGPEVLFGGFDNDDAVNPFELWNDTDTTPLVAGQGYRTGIDTAASANFVSFEGTVNASEVLVAIDQGTASILNLVGNPFPSYLDAQAFLSENAGVLDGSAQVIYGYNDSTDGTSSDDYTIISLLENTSVNIAPGQAFFVASNSTGGNIAFTTSSPDMRITSDQDDFIVGRNAAATITNVNISLTNASDNFITKVYFTPSSGLGLDPGYDASLIGGVAPGFALFSNLVEDNMNVPFATQALGKNDYNDTTVALGVNANMGEQLTFSIAQSTLPAEIEVYLDDTITSTSTLLNASDYIITPDSNLNGTGRFYLRFSNSALSLPENNLDNITIYTNPANRTINISGQIEAGTMAKIYDIQGRLVKTEVLSSNVTLHSIDGNALHAGVYIVELSHDNQRKSEKLILR
ncbi:MAG: T9SS type A sorting domain-containing protein, partial [Winogradskyella sp.]|uniref:T9SS type A sorting domain-containing protein n=1 Tax=Winogradskyella sp. TaxID=1883156 RepID=UPI0025E2F73E